MGVLTKETWRLYKFNLKNALAFEILYRLIATPLYLVILNRCTVFALDRAGYSYLTASNIGYFFVKPWTLVMLLTAAVIGILLLSLEAGCLLTLFQGAYYFQKLKPGEILAGGFLKLWDEIKKKNWRLGLLILADYGLSHLYLVYRVLTHVKPLNFVLSELFKQPSGWVILTVCLVFLVFFAVPGLYTFHACMIEQKNFHDGYLRSWWLLRKRVFKITGLLGAYYLLAILLLHGVYFFCVFVTAVGMTLFTDNSLALAVLPIAGDRIELVLIFITSMVLTVGNFGALSVQYYRFSSTFQKKSWNFSRPRGHSVKWWVTVVCALCTGASLVVLFDVVRNGSSMASDLLNEIQITAHRGSSKAAPENTMAAIERAVEDMADFVEIDVQETADGVVVLGHDTSLKRVAGVARTISSYTYEDLKNLDVGKWFSAEYEGERIPTLEEVMEYCKGRVNINIEIKNLGPDSPLPDKVAELIEKHQMKEQCVVTSTRMSYLVRIKELDEEIHTGYIISAAYGDYYSSGSIDFISIRSSFVSERLVEAAHEKGKAIHAWTVNSKSEMERMKMLGVDNIITDYPVLSREILYREEATENLLEYLRLVLK